MSIVFESAGAVVGVEGGRGSVGILSRLRTMVTDRVQRMADRAMEKGIRRLDHSEVLEDFLAARKLRR